MAHTGANDHETLFRFRGPDGRIASKDWTIVSRPGTYPYEDGLGHTGTIIVTAGTKVYLPPVLRN